MEATRRPGSRFPFGAVSIHASVMEATSGHCDYPRALQVSIHASVMEATVALYTPSICLQVSIHASVMEATTSAKPAPSIPRCFDPRLRDGGDLATPPVRVRTLQFRSTPP